MNDPFGAATIGRMIALLAAALAVAALAAVRAARSDRERAVATASLCEQVRALEARLEAVEAEAAHALAQSDATGGLLVEKGIADEEEFQAALRRADGSADAERGEDRLH